MTGVPDRIRIELGDITRLEVDAIVNAANSSLLGGCPPGEARLTRGYRLPAPHVIHTVGPVWRGGGAGEAEILAGCYRSCLRIAIDRRFRTIAFPAIATGVYGFPRKRAAEIAVAAVHAHLQGEEHPQSVLFVCFDEATRAAYRQALGLGQ